MPVHSFVAHFRNVSLILDCVSCEKCKLWGKLQILGIGTALKVLMSEAAGAAYDLERYADSRPNCPKKAFSWDSFGWDFGQAWARFCQPCQLDMSRSGILAGL